MQNKEGGVFRSYRQELNALPVMQGGLDGTNNVKMYRVPAKESHLCPRGGEAKPLWGLPAIRNDRREE